MNIILDASVLGIGFYHRQAQTGVGRVAERLMTGLWKASDISLSLAASSHLPETMRYAQTTLGSAGPVFVNRPAERRQAAIENGLLAPFSLNSLPTKVIRQAFYQGKKLLGGDEARFNTQLFPKGSIYHSPFYPIPDAVGQDQSVTSVQTIHDLIPIFHPEWFPKGDNTVRRVLDMLPPDAQVITVSEATKQDFCGYTRIDPTRVTPIQLAASPALFYPVTDPPALRAIRQRYNLGDAPYLLSLATFEPRKNIDHLVRCFAQLVQGGDIPAEVKLVLVGTRGWKFDQIMNELAQSDALRSRIIVTGFVPDAELAPLYSGAVGFVYPSLYEGFGLPPLEAMQCGLPVIASSIPALAEVVGDAALTVLPTDADALKQAMIRITQSASLRAELSVKSRARAGLFSWDRFIDQHIALYKTLQR